jgi:mono/diheme cytochrome c family protein
VGGIATSGFLIKDIDMRILSAWAAVVLIALPACALAADKSLGQVEYESKCGMCHGPAGKGDGWFASYLKSGPPQSLTRLKRDNGGVFPFDSVYHVIDGRKEVLVHGPRQMPVWGAAFRAEAGKQYDFSSGQYVADEGVTRARILALIEYISRFQE